MRSMSLHVPVWTCLLVLAVAPAAGREVPFVRQTTVDSSFAGVAALAAGDIDRDGVLDLVGAAETAGKLGWWRGVESSVFGYFPISAIDAAFDGAKSVALGDIDGDGDLDVVAGATTDMELAWWANNGDGSAWTKDVIASPGVAVRGVAVADVDRDGTLDVVAAGGDGLRWFSNDAGDGSAWTAMVVAAGGTFGGARGVAVGYLDDDGDVDVAAVAETDGDVAWFENTGAGATWTRHDLDTTFPDADAVAVADVEGDGSLDVAVGGAATAPADDVVWFENTAGDGSAFTARSVDAAFDQAFALLAADLDGDGDTDVIAAYGGPLLGRVSWYENDGTPAAGEWTEHTIDGGVTALGSPVAVAVGDVNRDGTLDVVAALRDDDDVVWYSNDAGDGTTWTRTDVDPAFNSPDTVRLADLDGDGDLDLAAVSDCADRSCGPQSELVAWENAGGQFSLATTGTAPAEIPSGGADDVLRIDARHLGRDGFSFHPEDSDAELTSLELLFEETGGDTREACLTITADPDVAIQTGADVVFRAADQVVLGDGFQVESGASFRVEMASPALCQP